MESYTFDKGNIFKIIDNMIKLKTLIFESLSPIEAEQIFSRYGVPNGI